MRHPKPKYFYPKNPQKYCGNVDGIICRSQLEKHFFVRFDTNPNIIAWGSEELSIPYFYPVDKSWHRYFPDNILKVKRIDGTTRKILVEIKPSSLCRPPRQPKRQTIAFVKRVQAYIKNESKWKAAKAWCLQHGCEFQILTEQDLFRKKN